MNNPQKNTDAYIDAWLDSARERAEQVATEGPGPRSREPWPDTDDPGELTDELLGPRKRRMFRQ